MHHLRRHRPTPALVVSIVALAVALGGVASASIPSENGTIHACHNAQGALSVIDAEGGKKCPAGEKALNWRSDVDRALIEARLGLGHDTGHARAGDSHASCTMGEILLTAGRTANGIPADGQLLPIHSHQALFSLIGTTYGGDGRETFAMPDLRRITPNHMTYSICDKGSYPSQR